MILRTLNRHSVLRVAPLAILVMTAFTARADLWFDPALVSGDAYAVADLSQFERGGEPAGSYDVSVWLNGAGGKSRRLRFVARNDPSVAGQPVSGPEGESHCSGLMGRGWSAARTTQ